MHQSISPTLDLLDLKIAEIQRRQQGLAIRHREISSTEVENEIQKRRNRMESRLP